MTLPQMIEGRGGHQILPLGLLAKESGVGLKLLKCFTWNIAPSDLVEAFDHAATRRLAAT
jgi:hypothetical protein